MIKGSVIEIDEQIVYNQLNGNEQAVWSLLLASGYLKVLSYEKGDETSDGTNTYYELVLTNNEVRIMFQKMILDWFNNAGSYYNRFVKALLAGRLKEMNAYMSSVALNTFSYFDTGKIPFSRHMTRLMR